MVFDINCQTQSGNHYDSAGLVTELKCLLQHSEGRPQMTFHQRQNYYVCKKKKLAKRFWIFEGPTNNSARRESNV